MQIIKTILIAAFLFLTACSQMSHVISYRDTAYLKAKSIPPLKIPPGLSSSSIQAEYPIPDRNYPESAKRVELVPPKLN